MDSKTAHFIGIGGIGISALARYFLNHGWKVSGSDLMRSSTTDELKQENIKIFIGHKRSNIKNGVDLVVYNQAIPENNPELTRAKELLIPCKSYPEVIGELTQRYKTIAIAGAHGKSTTTALIALILIKAGLDPTVIVGTKLKEFDNKNFRSGKSNLLVLEADEFKGAFWHYSPTIAVITNIDKEHLDFYKNFNNVKKSFIKFVKNINSDGALFLNKNYAKFLNLSLRNLPRAFFFSPKQKIAEKIKKIIYLPGKHNVLNALAAYYVAKYLGVSEEKILKIFREYKGAWRRMEYKGTYKTSQESAYRGKGMGAKHKIASASVYDDYAHHPTEIKATLAAFKEKWPKKQLICVYQAHQIARLKLLFKDFIKAFKCADKVIIIPTYKVAGRENNANSRLDRLLANKIGAAYIKNPSKDLKIAIESILIKNGDLQSNIVMMGAGDIIRYTDLLI